MVKGNFEALIFDNDGVLVDSEAIHVTVELELLSELGLDYERPAYLTRFTGLGLTEFYAALAEDYTQRGLGRFPAEFGELLHDRVWPRIESELEALPGAQALARQFGGPIAVASSAPMRWLRRKLELVGLLDIFDPRVYSADQVERSKPAPDLFLHAAADLRCAPERCLVVEDSVNGVKAALAAGMTVYGYTGGGHAGGSLARRLSDAGADVVFESHRDIALHLFQDVQVP